MERINNGKDSYLHCNVNCNPSDYQDMYNSSEECLEDMEAHIIGDCYLRQYSAEATETVLQHYRIKFNNWGGKWLNVNE